MQVFLFNIIIVTAWMSTSLKNKWNMITNSSAKCQIRVKAVIIPLLESGAVYSLWFKLVCPSNSTSTYIILSATSLVIISKHAQNKILTRSWAQNINI